MHSRGRRRATRQQRVGALHLAEGQRLVVPVCSAAGGVGRSAVAGLVAAALQQALARTAGGPVALADTAARGRSPWPHWVEVPARAGLAARFAQPVGADQSGQLVRAVTSAMVVGDGPPVCVWSDTGPLDARYTGCDPGPQTWEWFLPSVRAAVIDGDAYEGQRFLAQTAGGPWNTYQQWFAVRRYAVAPVWVTSAEPATLRQTLEVVAIAERVAIAPDRCLTVVVNQVGQGRLSPEARARVAMLDGRVRAVVRLPHLEALRAAARPAWAHLVAEPAVLQLFGAVAAAAGLAVSAGPPPISQFGAGWRMPPLAVDAVPQLADRPATCGSWSSTLGLAPEGSSAGDARRSCA